MSDQSIPAAWPHSSQAYTPDLEYGVEIQTAFEDFAKSHLSSDTSIRLLSAPTESGVEYSNLDEKQLLSHLGCNSLARYNMFFINRFLVKKKQTAPPDAAKLRASRSAFIALISHLNVAPAFIFALSRYYLPIGKGQRIFLDEQNACRRDFWYSMPVRMQVKCTDSQLRHTSSTGGSNQKDPFHYLHLPDHNADIRGGQIVLCFQYNIRGRSTSAIVVNLLDGRWPTTVEEPQKRIRESFSHPSSLELTEDPFFINLVYFTSILRLWTNALNSLNMQLITYENRLQDESQEQTDSQFQEDINKALHAMASHLHRYASELSSLEETLSEIAAHHKAIHDENTMLNDFQFQRIENGLRQVASQLRPIKHFETELEKKLQNILALLFNRIQLANANKTHELTVEMKKDSLSMKTIAILTMFFLPGTSFAALLAMPFFSQNRWLDDVPRFWVWVVLTVPSTGLAFAFYTYWKRRGQRSSKKTIDDEEGI